MLEVGPGTVVPQILSTLGPEDRFDIVEINPTFCSHLERQILDGYRGEHPEVAVALHESSIEAADLQASTTTSSAGCRSITEPSVVRGSSDGCSPCLPRRRPDHFEYAAVRVSRPRSPARRSARTFVGSTPTESRWCVGTSAAASWWSGTCCGGDHRSNVRRTEPREPLHGPDQRSLPQAARLLFPRSIAASPPSPNARPSGANPSSGAGSATPGRSPRRDRGHARGGRRTGGPGTRGYLPANGYDFLRTAIVERDFRPRREIEDDEIFVSDGSKGDCGH